jgi:putative membrane protein insertion efficiency factor
MVGRFVVCLIRVYQIVVSPYLTCCRFTPSCSTYAIDAIKAYGIVTGFKMAVKRIIRCRMTLKAREKTVGVNWGYDPIVVPTKNRDAPVENCHHYAQF